MVRTVLEAAGWIVVEEGLPATAVRVRTPSEVAMWMRCSWASFGARSFTGVKNTTWSGWSIIRWQWWQPRSRYSSDSRSVASLPSRRPRGEPGVAVAPMMWTISAAAMECQKVRSSPSTRRLHRVPPPGGASQRAFRTESLMFPRRTWVSRTVGRCSRTGHLEAHLWADVRSGQCHYTRRRFVPERTADPAPHVEGPGRGSIVRYQRLSLLGVIVIAFGTHAIAALRRNSHMPSPCNSTSRAARGASAALTHEARPRRAHLRPAGHAERGVDGYAGDLLEELG
ncbi:MAG: hypothetical protein JWQ67_1442 [Marmoricola sp.]|nr:hypothetical protein [Marmoricola sp.]